MILLLNANLKEERNNGNKVMNSWLGNTVCNMILECFTTMRMCQGARLWI